VKRPDEPSLTVGALNYQVKQRVTLPTLSHKFPDVLDVAVMFKTAFTPETSINEDGGKRVVHVARVLDLTDG
jgi:hypothetical protein